MFGFGKGRIQPIKIGDLILLSGLSMILISCSALNRKPAPVDTRPDDFLIEYEWVEGSLPPPYHYEYTIRIGSSGMGEVEMIPDYPSDQTPVWVEELSIEEVDLDQLYRRMVEKGIFPQDWRARDDPPVGGSSEWLSVTANGREFEIPAYVVSSQELAVSEIYTTIRSLVPQAIWEKLNTQREQYVKEYSSP
jgi:hypothetical protein